MMKNTMKRELAPCEVCGYPVVRYEYGVCMKCDSCGWESGGENDKFEKEYHISYPMMVPLSRAREQYKQGIPFKATFEDFINGLSFYSEVAFTFGKINYGVCFRQDHSVLFYGDDAVKAYPTKDDFYAHAEIGGRLLKDIWDEVEAPRFM